MRGADVVFFVTRSCVAHIAVLATAAALPGCALGDEDSAGESSENAQLTALGPPVFNLNGTWTDFGPNRPKISETNGAITVDMSPRRRSPARGNVIDAFTITVTFDDDGTFTGTLQPPNLINWSNDTAWEKVFTGNLVFNINRQFNDGSRIIDVSAPGDGFVDMTSGNRPIAHGFAINATQIQITFSNNDTFIGTLDPNNIRIIWSNRTQWR